MAASRATVVRLMVPTDANFMGNVFGGVILSEIDRVSYVTATRHARTTCVTASMDRVDFRSPVHVGDMVEFRSELTYVGRSSMEVLVQARSEAMRGGPRRPVVDALVTMVALGPDGLPTPVPRLRLRNPSERRRFEEGRARMARRRKSRGDRTRRARARAPMQKVNR